jgi:hypothetical protein
MFRTAEECFASKNFNGLVEMLQSYIQDTSKAFPFVPRDWSIEDIVINIALPIGHNLNFHCNGVPFLQLVMNGSASQNVNITDISSDSLLKAICQAGQAMKFTKIRQDFGLKEPINARQISLDA